MSGFLAFGTSGEGMAPDMVWRTAKHERMAYMPSLSSAPGQVKR